MDDRTAIARAALEDYRPDDAVRALEPYEQARGEGSQAHLLLAEALIALGDTDRASRIFAITQFSDDLSGHAAHIQGKLSLAQGDLPGAGRAFDRSLARAPDNAELWADIAWLRYRGGEHLDVPDAIQRALAIDPVNASARHLQALLTRDAAGLRRAVPQFETLVGEVRSPAIRYDAAATLADAGETGAALELLETAGDEANVLRGLAAARGGDWALARVMLGRVPPNRATEPATMLLQAIVDLASGLDDAAAQGFDALLERQPDNRVVQNLLALSLYRSGAYRELATRFAERASQPNASVYLRTLIGRSYEARDMREEAARFLDPLQNGGVARFTPFAGAGGESMRSSLRDRIASGEAATILPEARAFVEANPASADAARLLGDVYLGAGEWKEALFQYERAGQTRADWPLVQRLVVAHQRLAQTNEAFNVLQRYIAGGGRERGAVAMYANLLAQRSDHSAATRLYSIAFDQGGRNDPALLARWSGHAVSAGETALALETAWQAYRLAPSDPRAVEALLAATSDENVRFRMQAKLTKVARR